MVLEIRMYGAEINAANNRFQIGNILPVQHLYGFHNNGLKYWHERGRILWNVYLVTSNTNIFFIHSEAIKGNVELVKFEHNINISPG